MAWIIDDRVNLSATCRMAKWHLPTAIVLLMNEGLAREEATAFAELCFDDHAQGGKIGIRHGLWGRISIE